MDPTFGIPDSIIARLVALVARGLEAQDELAIELEDVPVVHIEAALEDQLAFGWDDDERVTFLGLLACDRRDYVRERVAEKLGGFVEPLPVALETLLQRLVSDPRLSVRQAAAESLARILQSCQGFTRTRLVGSWAVATMSTHRHAIAQALRFPFEAVGAVSAVELLARDGEPEVRAAAAEAAKTRLKDAPRVCTTILRQLAQDPDATVRRAAGLSASEGRELND